MAEVWQHLDLSQSFLDAEEQKKKKKKGILTQFCDPTTGFTSNVDLLYAGDDFYSHLLFENFVRGSEYGTKGSSSQFLDGFIV